MAMRLSGWVFTAGMMSVIGAAMAAGHSHTRHSAEEKSSQARPALAVGVTLDTQGRLWLVKVDNQRLHVSQSADGGQHFSAPVVVSTVPEDIVADGENRPKIAVARDGTVLLTWTQALPQNYSGNIRFARSVDGGRHFSTPVTLNDDDQITAHRFDTLATDGAGRVVVSWLDARDKDAAKHRGETFGGTSVYTAQSSDNGVRFGANRRVLKHSCECCRIALTWSADGPVAFWRNLYGSNTRDFALANLDAIGRGSQPNAADAVRRATDDDWRIDACPHHGGDVAAGDGALHLVWFTQGTARQGLFYKRINGTRESTPLAFGTPSAQAGHAGVAAAGKTVVLAWREFDGANYVAMAMRSDDGGARFGAPQRLAVSGGAADYPLPLTDGTRTMVVWNSLNEGVRVVPVLPQSAKVARE